MAQYTQTVLEICNTVLTRIRGVTGVSAPKFGVVLDFFNDALMELQLQHDWKWLHKKTTAATVADQVEVILPVGLIEIDEVWVIVDGEGRDLTQMTLKEARLSYPDDTSTGSPAGYVMGEYDVSDSAKSPIKRMDMKPTPDAIYTLNLGYKQLIQGYTSAGGNTGEVPQVPAYLYPAIKESMYAKLLAHEKNPANEIQLALALYTRLVELAIQMDDKKNAPSQVQQAHYLDQYRRRRYQY